MTLPNCAFYKVTMLRENRFSALLVAAVLAASAFVTEATGQTRTVKRSGEWRVLAHDGPEGRICFAVATPKSSEPAAASNGAHFYISAWPKDGVRAEISVKTGVPLKAGAPASIALDQTFYKAFSKGDRAYVIDTTDELKLLEAMKKGSTVMVVAQSEQGVISKDTYSLSGLSQALQTVSAGCK
ncbi:MAG: invasion associated locus B family protein [Hyphomicrobiaceae bacterium]